MFPIHISVFLLQSGAGMAPQRKILKGTAILILEVA